MYGLPNETFQGDREFYLYLIDEVQLLEQLFTK